MRTAFAHLLPLDETETKKLWSEGTLTVDANVILDLYRFHPETRGALLTAMRAFEDRLWLSHQAASEFVRNRGRAATTVVKELTEADADLKKLEDASKRTGDDLRGRRPLPRQISQTLMTDIAAAIQRAREGIEEARSGEASRGSTDGVLQEVLSLFEGRVGKPPIDEELRELHKEAERRIKAKIPPGYKDAEKEGTGPHGDYFLWHQVLQHAKATAKPVILVTSERKEDWWDKAHGKTFGARHEMLEEAHRVAGQRIVIYQTDSFIEHAAKNAGATVSSFLLNDIRSARVGRELEDIVASAVEALAGNMIDDDTLVNSRIAETNASSWQVDEVEVTQLGALDYQSCSASFTAQVCYAGVQDDERFYYGEKITAEIRGVVTFEDGEWGISEYDIVSAEIDNPRDDEDDDGRDDQ